MIGNFFNLRDLVKIVSRKVGTGYIGGKSVGMLLARKIIKNADGDMAGIQKRMEPDDFFFIGADVLNLHKNIWESIDMEKVLKEDIKVSKSLFVTEDKQKVPKEGNFLFG